MVDGEGVTGDTRVSKLDIQKPRDNGGGYCELICEVDEGIKALEMVVTTTGGSETKVVLRRALKRERERKDTDCTGVLLTSRAVSGRALVND